MGAGNILPTIPIFSTSAPSLDDLNNLSYAVSFVSDCDTRPTFKLYTKAQQSITSGSWNTVTLASVAKDSDGVSDGTGATIVTQGYYNLRGMVQIVDTTTDIQLACAFKLTAGPNNPNLTGTKRFGQRADGTQSVVSTAGTAICAEATTPIPCYPGDQIVLQISVSAAATLDYNKNTNYQEGRFVPNLSGTWVRTGS
jgi:hypothetical protein